QSRVEVTAVQDLTLKSVLDLTYSHCVVANEERCQR
ncbi:MAG: hypothetical protein RL701_1157, partial [Pseudomonadota bacterium]